MKEVVDNIAGGVVAGSIVEAADTGPASIAAVGSRLARKPGKNFLGWGLRNFDNMAWLLPSTCLNWDVVNKYFVGTMPYRLPYSIYVYSLRLPGRLGIAETVNILRNFYRCSCYECRYRRYKLPQQR